MPGTGQVQSSMQGTRMTKLCHILATLLCLSVELMLWCNAMFLPLLKESNQNLYEQHLLLLLTYAHHKKYAAKQCIPIMHVLLAMHTTPRKLMASASAFVRILHQTRLLQCLAHLGHAPAILGMSPVALTELVPWAVFINPALHTYSVQHAQLSSALAGMAGHVPVACLAEWKLQ
jgi:hypothetical protein